MPISGRGKNVTNTAGIDNIEGSEDYINSAIFEILRQREESRLHVAQVER